MVENNRKLQHFIIVVFIVTLTSGCATITSQPSDSAYKENYLKNICAKNGVYWQWDHVSQVATLGYKGINAEVLVGSDLVLVNKDRVTLSSKVRMVRSAVIVPADFESKVIGRLRQQAIKKKGFGLSKIREIIIDAGHGGKDPGAIGKSGVKEKEIVLDISKRLARELRSKGFKVEMTRKNDQFISLQKRTEMASRFNGDLFISVHANSSSVRGVHGLEVFTAKPLGYKDKMDAQRATNSQLLFRNLSIKRHESNVEKIVSDMLYSHKQSQSQILAEWLSKKTSHAIKTKNRGDKVSRFYVLRNTLIPAVLVEVGFLTNPKESRLLQTGSYRQRIASSLAKNIYDYANGR